MDALRDHPLTREAIQRNRLKACFALQGITSGLVADQRLNELEVLYLEAWLRRHQDMADDPDIVDLCDHVSDILADGVVTADELADLAGLLACVAEFRGGGEQSQRDAINQLLGILEGISADEVLNEKEILFLKDWLDSHPAVAEVWPGSALAAQIREVLEDGVIDGAERAELLEKVKQICGNSFTETGMAGGMSARGFCDPVPDGFSLAGLRICLTGNFLAGRRRVITARLQAMGAEVKAGMSKQVEVLLIGGLVSPDWLFTSHGGKIQEALRLKEEGLSLILVPEEEFPYL